MAAETLKRHRALARWHRRIALAACLWLVVLTVSGVLINHAHDWGLDRATPPALLLESVYGMTPAADGSCPRGAVPGADCGDLFARYALRVGELLVGRHDLYLFDGQGRLVEAVSAAQLGLSEIRAVLRQGQNLFLRDARQTVRTDVQLVGREPVDPGTARTLAARTWQQGDESGVKITWERVLLDLHAARFLGPAAPIFTDLMAGLLLALALSGVWLWWVKNRRNRSPGA